MFHLLGICTESQLDDLSFITPGKGRNHNGKGFIVLLHVLTISGSNIIKTKSGSVKKFWAGTSQPPSHCWCTKPTFFWVAPYYCHVDIRNIQIKTGCFVINPKEIPRPKWNDISFQAIKETISIWIMHILYVYIWCTTHMLSHSPSIVNLFPL